MKITKWKVLQKDSSIGLLLLIVGFFAFLLIVLGPTTIGVKITDPGSVWQTGVANGGITNTTHAALGGRAALGHLTLGASNGDGSNEWSNTGEALAVIGMVLAGISWLAICVGWYFDPTTLDERITLTIAAAALFVGMVFAIAGPAYESNWWVNNQHLDSNKGYIAGMEILAIVPSILTMLLMVEPLMMVYNKNYKSKAGLAYKQYEKDLEAQETKVSK